MPTSTQPEDKDKQRRDRLWALIAGGIGMLGLTRIAGNGERDTPQDDLADLLYRLRVRGYEESLRQAVAAAGGDSEKVRLTNPEILAELRAEAAASARSIATTLEADLRRMVMAAPADVEAHDMPGLIQQWLTLRTPWKSDQIARTEMASAAAKAVRDFGQRTSGRGTAHFGGSLRCALCQAIAAGNPYEIDDPMVGILGHPNCLDDWTITWHSLDTLWTGA